MSYGRYPYGGVGYAGADVAEIPQDDKEPTLAVEVAFTTGALVAPVWEDITSDVRSWDVSRGRSRELERFQPGRATVVLGNLSRQYDSANAAGPHFGDVRPMRRIRIRETFNGVTYPVFDGFVDKWQLDYPGVGKDATATATATDAFKIFARTGLPRSVYTDEAEADAPNVWLRLDDVQTIVDTSNLVLNHGSSAFDGSTLTSAGEQKFGAQGLITHDPGSACEFFERAQENIQVAEVVDEGPFTVECWFRLSADPTVTNYFWEAAGTGSASLSLQLNATTMKLGFVYQNNAGGAFSAQPSEVINVGQRYHVVCVHDANRLLHVYINGDEGAYDTQQTTTGDTDLDSFWVGSAGANASLLGTEAEFAIYDDNALSSARISDHYTAGSTPWTLDQPAGRIRRVLTLLDWPGGPLYLPDEFTELDSGNVQLQSAALGVAALEHLQKVGETEFGLLFIDRAGRVRFVDRAAVFARTPGQAVFGDADDGVEVGYREFVPDDGDDVIRNRAIISRLNGVAQTSSEGFSVTEFGRFDYRLEGLLHASDAHSSAYAGFIVDQYGSPRRRIVSLSLGPAGPGDEGVLYPAMLGPELGDAITVRSRPPGGGATFEQVCVIEGIRHRGVPKRLETTFILSPEFIPPGF